jgi:hypothetical protein
MITVLDEFEGSKKLLTPLSFLSAQGLLTTEIDGGKFQ